VHPLATKRNGLLADIAHANLSAHPAYAIDHPGSIGPVHSLIPAVHIHQYDYAFEPMSPLLGSDATLVPLPNGVQAPSILAERFGQERTIGGLCAVISEIAAPGRITQHSQVQQVVIGELDKQRSSRVERLVEAWQQAGVDAVHADDIEAAMWSKFLLIASWGGVSSLARATVGEILGREATREVYFEALHEVARLARARGVDLDHDVVAQRIEFTEKLEPDSTTSMQRDVEAGRPFELEAFSGAIVRMAADAGVKVSVHRTIYALLLPALKRALKERVR
jgi:2-dehydropantoate 2-reductase